MSFDLLPLPCWGIQAADIEDIAQEVLISVRRKLGDFRKTEKGHSFRGWLYRVTKNAIINFLRYQAKHPGSGRRFRPHEDDRTSPDEPPEDSSVTQPGIGFCRSKTLEMAKAMFDERSWGIYWRFKIDNVPAQEVAKNSAPRLATFGRSPSASRSDWKTISKGWWSSQNEKSHRL